MSQETHGESTRQTQSAEHLRSIVESQPAAQAAAHIAKAMWDKPASCLNALGALSALSVDPRSIKTVGVYYLGLGMGGAERVVASLIALWDRMGYSVVLFTDDQPHDGEYELPRGVTRVVIPDFRTITPDTYEARCTSFVEALHAHHVDALVYCQWLSPVLAWDMLACKLANVAFLVYTHGSFRTMVCEGNPRDFDLISVYRWADGVVVLSDADQRFHSMGNPQVFRTINPPTLLPSDVEPAPLTSSTIIWVGRVDPWDKRPQEAIHIMAHVVKRCPQARLQFLGAPPSEQVIDDLTRLARDCGVADNVEFLGAHRNVAPYLQNASAYLLTSKYEGWCLTLAEAKAAGLPCVMYEMPYLSLAEGARGIIPVAHLDHEQAADALCSLLEDEALRHRLGTQAREHMEEVARFDVEGLWERIFSALACGSPSRATVEENDCMWDTLIDGCKTSLANLNWAVSDREAQLEQARHEAHAAEKRAEEEQQAAQQARDDAEFVRNSTSYKAGLAITALPRKLKRMKGKE